MQNVRTKNAFTPKWIYHLQAGSSLDLSTEFENTDKKKIIIKNLGFNFGDGGQVRARLKHEFESVTNNKDGNYIVI